MLRFFIIMMVQNSSFIASVHSRKFYIYFYVGLISLSLLKMWSVFLLACWRTSVTRFACALVCREDLTFLPEAGGGWRGGEGGGGVSDVSLSQYSRRTWLRSMRQLQEIHLLTQLPGKYLHTCNQTELFQNLPRTPFWVERSWVSLKWFFFLFVTLHLFHYFYY